VLLSISKNEAGVSNHYYMSAQYKISSFTLLHDQNKSDVYLDGRILSSQQSNLKLYKNSADWLEKTDPPKSHFCFDDVNRINIIKGKFMLFSQFSI